MICTRQREQSIVICALNDPYVIDDDHWHGYAGIDTNIS